jgi:hypothetical protein
MEQRALMEVWQKKAAATALPPHLARLAALEAEVLARPTTDRKSPMRSGPRAFASIPARGE